MKSKKRSIRKLSEYIDVSYGMYDRPGPSIGTEDKIDLNFEPIVPVEQVSTQLSVDRPPVDDPDYLPTNRRSFETAMSTLASYVPEEMISDLYVLVRDKIEKMVDDKLVSSKSAGVATMESLENKIKKILLEQLSDDELRRMQADFDEEFGDSKEAVREPVVQDELSLDQIAKQTGFTGPSGVKNFLYRLLSRMARFENVPSDELDALVDFAAGEYVDVLHQAELIEKEDADFLLKNKKQVFDLPSFKFFISNAIAAPALKELERTGKKKVDTLLSKLKLTDKTKNALLNQLVGQVPKNESLIFNRIEADVSAGKMTKDEAEAAKNKISSGFSAMKKIVMSGDDFVEVALQRYAKMPKSKLLSIMKKAADDPFVAEKM